MMTHHLSSQVYIYHSSISLSKVKTLNEGNFGPLYTCNNDENRLMTWLTTRLTMAKHHCATMSIRSCFLSFGFI